MRLVLVTAIALVSGCARPPAMSTATPSQLYTPVAEPAGAAPVGLVTPTPPPRTHRYTSKLAVVDTLLVASMIPALWWADEEIEVGAVGVAYFAGFAAAGPLIHRNEGNPRVARRSLARRLGYTALGVLAGVVASNALMDDDPDGLGWVYVALPAAGWSIGAVIAAVQDWGQARVER